MTLFLDAILLGLAIGVVRGGHISRLSTVRLRLESLLVGLFVLQLTLPRLATAINVQQSAALYLWLLIMLALVVVALMNHRQAGLQLVAIGIGLNALVIALNGAMPVSERAVSAVVGHEYHMTAADSDLLHEPLRKSTIAAPLSDLLPLPGPDWHRGVVSVGDLLLAAGIARFVFVVMVGKGCAEEAVAADAAVNSTDCAGIRDHNAE